MLHHVSRLFVRNLAHDYAPNFCLLNVYYLPRRFHRSCVAVVDRSFPATGLGVDVPNDKNSANATATVNVNVEDGLSFKEAPNLCSDALMLLAKSWIPSLSCGGA